MRDHDDLARLQRANSTPAARWIAGVFTPANVVLALMAYISITYSPTLVAGILWWALALALVVGVPYLILFRALRTGRIDDRQVVRRSQRPSLFAAAGLAVAVALAVLYVAGAPHRLVWLVLAMLWGLLVMGVTTIWWKASMHLAVSAGAVAVVALENPTAGALCALAIPLIGWARWRDGRHSLPQLIGGAVIGGITAGLVYGLLT